MDALVNILRRIPVVYEILGDTLYVRHDGCIECIDYGRLVEAAEELFGGPVRLERSEDGDRLVIVVEAREARVTIVCMKPYRGCQAEFVARIGGRRVHGDCKIECISGDPLASALVAVMLAYARVPAEYQFPEWRAKLA